ncbi:hypothetical protein BDR06DRAFT_1000544 [Suillus hirtellus]|nr:hypothetical protein BDR06DRAFT_1000544 [Suillus hirtellus]
MVGIQGNKVINPGPQYISSDRKEGCQPDSSRAWTSHATALENANVFNDDRTLSKGSVLKHRPSMRKLRSLGNTDSALIASKSLLTIISNICLMWSFFTNLKVAAKKNVRGHRHHHDSGASRRTRDWIAELGEGSGVISFGQHTTIVPASFANSLSCISPGLGVEKRGLKRRAQAGQMPSKRSLNTAQKQVKRFGLS